ncbi:MAG TPA: helix-turn-helix transcriptional regulator [Saprospiraceae bacterium]|jgi:transcriptional regulator with XRE-family HTH domain|nr:helix-turn-helix transcriptional regulator [Saprospiraceae bacterium]HMT72211.1 helix-turn-helix transcriptional regulator [Saprospiraceae bacterium]
MTENNTIIQDIIDTNPNPEADRFIHLCMSFLDEVHDILERKGMTQAELAAKMGKSPAEVSRMINGLQNVTFKTIAKLSTALDEDIMMTKSEAKTKYGLEGLQSVFSVKLEKNNYQLPWYPPTSGENTPLTVVYRKTA